MTRARRRPLHREIFQAVLGIFPLSFLVWLAVWAEPDPPVVRDPDARSSAIVDTSLSFARAFSFHDLRTLPLPARLSVHGPPLWLDGGRVAVVARARDTEVRAPYRLVVFSAAGHLDAVVPLVSEETCLVSGREVLLGQALLPGAAGGKLSPQPAEWRVEDGLVALDSRAAFRACRNRDLDGSGRIMGVTERVYGLVGDGTASAGIVRAGRGGADLVQGTPRVPLGRWSLDRALWREAFSLEARSFARGFLLYPTPRTRDLRHGAPSHLPVWRVTPHKLERTDVPWYHGMRDDFVIRDTRAGLLLAVPGALAHLDSGKWVSLLPRMSEQPALSVSRDGCAIALNAMDPVAAGRRVVMTAQVCRTMRP